LLIHAFGSLNPVGMKTASETDDSDEPVAPSRRRLCRLEITFSNQDGERRWYFYS
jgi:hypothetical protein